MPIYQYVKYAPKRRMRRSLLISFSLIGVGCLLLMWVGWPILSFHLFSQAIFADVISPVGGKNSPANGNDIVYASNGTDKGIPAVDYTNANVWFPLKPQKKVSSIVNTYHLSIPKLGIKDAFVVIGGDDLNRSLIHYGGTALPGQNGNGAIFGHSVLPQFFNPKNYKTIFSTIPTMEVGDDILVTYDMVTYRYRVDSMKVKGPEDISVLEQTYDDAYITLVTCVPPGTYWQRLDVRARLVKI